MAVSRTLPGIIQATAAPTAQHGSTGSPAPARMGLHLARFARARLRGLIGNSQHGDVRMQALPNRMSGVDLRDPRTPGMHAELAARRAL